jgi:hypothetical protein
MMRAGRPFTGACFGVALAAACLWDCRTASAQREPIIVVPGRAGVPVMFWGQDVSGDVIYGEFGLDRPGQGAGVTVIPPIGPYYRGIPPELPGDGYFPSSGRFPRVGRDEVLPSNQGPPKPAQSFNRSWTSESPELPANVEPPFNPPAVIVAPQINGPAPRPPARP